MAVSENWIEQNGVFVLYDEWQEVGWQGQRDPLCTFCIFRFQVDWRWAHEVYK